ncbi:hypothetical protein [Paraflavitalea sp. CAU 1676]|uniref:hypothetical protein n=1 Tax=Paraflavitalea sp. CAU 1676 TaxID=3032598 RepID=UPI0023D9DF2C|nr:hypothetical protein [Paraflavitalea sp. CAU 1676]MDF2190079.1 hypothetical protein [Paraflavitalea sp. CAU 1676]
MDLNANMIVTVKSYVFFTQYRPQIVVGSPEALRKTWNKAMTTTLFAGWWGIPWGIVYTIKGVGFNLVNKKLSHATAPTDYLRTFVRTKIGEIEAYKNDPEKLRSIIARRLG